MQMRGCKVPLLFGWQMVCMNVGSRKDFHHKKGHKTDRPRPELNPMVFQCHRKNVTDGNEPVMRVQKP